MTMTRIERMRTALAAKRLVAARLEHFNQFYQFTYSRVTIRNQKTRWGSCSARGALSFNIRLALLDPALADFVVVHELCHLREMNHSERFWALVAQTIPDWRVRRQALRQIRISV